MTRKLYSITSIFRTGAFAFISAFLIMTPVFGEVCAQDSLSTSHSKEILFGGGFIIPLHPEVYSDAATGIGIEAEAGLGFVISDQITLTGLLGIGHIPAGYKIEPEYLEICSDQYKFESLLLLFGMCDARMYTVPNENQQVRPYVLAGAGVLNANQKSIFTERDIESFRCIILDGYEKRISKWSLMANGGFGLDVSLEDKNFTMLFQARYIWVMDAIFENMQNIVVEMMACIHL
jgi:hypothetical protein